VEQPVLDVRRDLLRPQQRNPLDPVVVDRTVVVAVRTAAHGEIGGFQEPERLFLQRPFRDHDLQHQASSVRKKQLRAPVWHAAPSWWTRPTSTSASQSPRSSSPCCPCPLVSPFRQSSCRERLQNTVRPSSIVSATDSRFIHAIIKTSPVSTSCTTAAISPRSSNVSASSATASITASPAARVMRGAP